jgi:glycosyltransferase involved in cell wall biosynthesis
VVHIHGIWNPWWALVAQFLHWRGVPFVVSPHGSLEPGALSIRRHKKLAALVLYQKRALKQTNALVVTSDKEARGVAALRFGVPIQVISNGVQLHSVTSYALDARGVKGDNGPRTLLFLSRIHPIKGLSILVRAWARVRKDGWRVVVAGNDEQGHLAEIQALAETLGVRADFEFPGAVGGEAKLDLFEQADVFVLPTKSENFGIVVAEALSHGVPVITTHGAPWSGLVDNGCGWWCPIDEVALAQAMAEAMDLPRQTLAAMGSAGREWVRREFNWDTIARQALETLYLPALQSRA